MKQGITPQYWKQENNGRYSLKNSNIQPSAYFNRHFTGSSKSKK